MRARPNGGNGGARDPEGLPDKGAYRIPPALNSERPTAITAVLGMRKVSKSSPITAPRLNRVLALLICYLVALSFPI